MLAFIDKICEKKPDFDDFLYGTVNRVSAECFCEARFFRFNDCNEKGTLIRITSFFFLLALDNVHPNTN